MVDSEIAAKIAQATTVATPRTLGNTPPQAEGSRRAQARETATPQRTYTIVFRNYRQPSIMLESNF